MDTWFRWKLTITMIVFAILISFTVAITDHIQLNEQIADNHNNNIRHIEEIVAQSLHAIEKAYHLFGNELAHSMEESSRQLVDLYEQEPDFDQWDLAALKQTSGFDIYLINDHNVITHSSFPGDIGMDFSACCGKLSSVLDARREAGGFYHDGIDIEQQTGIVKKYSYMATQDHRFLIQLGYSLENEPIFKHYNFLETIDELVEEYAMINEMNILNIGGYAFGEPIARTRLTPERRDAFERSLSTRQATEVEGMWNDEQAIYRYVFYASPYDEGTTQRKIVEIVYSEHELKALSDKSRNQFLLRLLFVLMITVLMSFLITRWISRPMYLAFHDPLTGLKNRAAMEEMLGKFLQHRMPFTVLMIDLDNFKKVNDLHGHDAGDNILKAAASCIQACIRSKDTAFRLGGDEFIIIMPEAHASTAEQTAHAIISAMQQSLTGHYDLYGKSITVSIGIALAPQDGRNAEALLRNADMAMYASKKKGKNRYDFYDPNIS